MPFLGPNCYGLINYLDGAPLWPDQHGGQRVERGVAILSQSSNIAITLTMNRRCVPLAAVVTLGNRSRLGAAAVMDALLDDDRITAIGLLVETLDDATILSAAAQKAREKRIPVVAFKLGRSEERRPPRVLAHRFPRRDGCRGVSLPAAPRDRPRPIDFGVPRNA